MYSGEYGKLSQGSRGYYGTPHIASYVSTPNPYIFQGKYHRYYYPGFQFEYPLDEFPPQNYISSYECNVLDKIVSEYKKTNNYEKFTTDRAKWHALMVTKYGLGYPEKFCDMYGGHHPHHRHHKRSGLIGMIVVHEKSPEHISCRRNFRECPHCHYLENMVLKM